jgi:hypothetical protein
MAGRRRHGGAGVAFGFPHKTSRGCPCADQHGLRVERARGQGKGVCAALLAGGGGGLGELAGGIKLNRALRPRRAGDYKSRQAEKGAPPVHGLV